MDLAKSIKGFGLNKIEAPARISLLLDMKWTIIVLGMTLFSSIGAQNTDYPVGRVHRHIFFNQVHAPVFEPGFKAYEPNKEAIETLKSERKHITFKCVMGFWCEDSQLYTPHFFKIMDEAKIDENDYKVFAVNEEKQAAFEGFNALNISYVPTIIMYYDKKEIGRVVEIPEKSLEEDLAKKLHDYLNP